MQFDLFDQGSDSQPGSRQIDLETMIEEKMMNEQSADYAARVAAYERKREAKRDRLDAAADRAEAQSMAAYKRADLREEVSGIPLGQPILVGHHSEGRHRAAIKRAENAMRASIAADKRAGDLRSRADGIGSGGISSDDPAAMQKLQAEIDAAQGLQDFMKAANAVIRKAVKAGATAEAPIEALEPWMAALQTATGKPWGEGSIRDALKPDFCGRIGFAAYRLQNNGANIKRMEQRIAVLRSAEAARVAAGGEEKRTAYQGLCEVVENFDENRLQILFDGKPGNDVRDELKSNGFRWAPSQGAWQRQLTNAARYAATRFLRSQGVEV